MKSAIIAALEVVEKLAPLIPVAGQAVSSIMGSASILLKAAETLDDDKDKLYILALRAYDLSIVINTATKDKWDNLPERVKAHVDEIQLTLEGIGDFFQHCSTKSRIRLLVKRLDYSKKVKGFVSDLDREFEKFRFSTATEILDATRQTLTVSNQSFDLVQQTYQTVLSLKTRCAGDLSVISTTASTDGLVRGLDDDGLRVFDRALLQPGGYGDAKTLLTIVKEPCVCSAWHKYGSDTDTPQDNITAVEIVTRVVSASSKLYAVKRFSSTNYSMARKSFLYDKDIRIRLEGTHFLPKFVGTVGAFGNYPCQVFELGSGRQYLKFSDLLRSYDPYTSNSFAIFALFNFKSALMQWDLLPEHWGCSLISSGEDNKECAMNVLEETMVEIDLRKRKIMFNLLYTGELGAVSDFESGEGFTNNDLWEACRNLTPPDLGYIPDGLEIGFIDEFLFDNIDPHTSLPGIAPLLLGQQFLTSPWRAGLGYALSVGDVGYLIRGTFILLGNVRDYLGDPNWEVSIPDVVGRWPVVSDDGIYTFALPPRKREVILTCGVNQALLSEDSHALFTRLQSLCTNTSEAETLFIVTGWHRRSFIHYSLTGPADGDGLPVAFVHVLPSYCTSDDTATVSLYITHQRIPELGHFSNGLCSGSEVNGEHRAEWYMCQMQNLQSSYMQGSSVPCSYFGPRLAAALQAPPIDTRCRAAFEIGDGNYTARKFWSCFLDRHLDVLWEYSTNILLCNNISADNSVIDQEHDQITFHFQPNPYFENSTFTLNVPADMEMPTQLTHEELIWKTDPNYPFSLYSIEVAKSFMGEVTFYPGLQFYRTLYHFLYEAHKLHVEVTVDGVSDELLVLSWQKGVGAPLRRFARAVKRIHAALQERQYDFKGMDPINQRWWNVCGRCDGWLCCGGCGSVESIGIPQACTECSSSDGGEYFECEGDGFTLSAD